MTSHEIRKRFLTFFEKRQHAILDSASLVTTDDPGATNATLFNTAGMQSLIPYLMGEDHPNGERLASSQKCVRTNDLEEVGDNTHATFFEMLGNWSLGDYFKTEAIQWSWEFLTDANEGLGLDPSRLYVTVFAGNDDVPRDMESVEIWKQYIPENRIYYRDSKDNWWTAGSDSPAGPSTEMFYDLTGSLGDLSDDEFEAADEKQDLVEIWNDVFMSYRLEGGKIAGELPQKNVDTGAGLERVSAVMQNVSSIFETDLFMPLISHINEHAESYGERHARIVADHIKTATFMIADGVKVSNTGRGYILRRIIRRSVQSMQAMGYGHLHTAILIDRVIEMYNGVYPLDMASGMIHGVIAGEIEKFLKTLERGRREFTKLSAKPDFDVTGQLLANLEQTHGLPFDLACDIATEMDIEVTQEARDNYQKLTTVHQDTSRSGAEKKFKGGLAEDTPKIRALHTATHLMLAGLRKYLGDDVFQKGSQITEERTRFDFNYGEKVSREILDQVEQYVNDAITANAAVSVNEMDKTEAQKSDVVGSFWEKYPDTVNVYSIDGGEGSYSRELCGGPHVEHTNQIAEFGVFKIKKEESSSAGVRRIKAILE